jgi:hypothetical protein
VPDPRPEKPGLALARQALRLARRPADDSDRPPLKPFPGRKAKPLPGQLDMFGAEAQR